VPRERTLAYILAVAVCAIVLDVVVRLALIATIGASR
jgi:hypothetical protein